MTDISKLTDAELSAAVAVERRGWARTVSAGGHIWWRAPGSKISHGSPPAYATDAAQMVELLEHERQAGRDWTINPMWRAKPDNYTASLMRNQGRLVSRYPAEDGSPHTDWACAATPARALAEAVLAHARSE